MQLASIVNLERKLSTTLSFPGLSKIVISSSYNNNNQSIILLFVIGLFIKKQMADVQCVQIIDTR